MTYDVLIIGGGAAGLSAAITLSRARRRVLVVDGGRPRNAPADGVHNYLGREGTPPLELMAIGRGEVEHYGGEVVDGTVVAITGTSGAFSATLDSGATVTARRVVVATGLRDELPELPGLAARWGRDVIHCPYCHGWEVRDRVIGILGTGPGALHQAMLFRQWTDHVVLLEHRLPSIPEEQRALLTARGVRIVPGEVTGLVVRDDAIVGATVNGETVAIDALTVAPRAHARVDFLAPLGLVPVVDEMGSQLEHDAMGRTAVAGIRVAGSAGDVKAQVVVSAADGLLVAAALNAELIEEEFQSALAKD